MLKTTLPALVLFVWTGLCAAADTLTLDRCIMLALQHNPRLITARANAQSAQGRLTVSRAAYFPQISATAQATAASGNGTVATGNLPYQTSLGVQQMLFDFGKTPARSKSEKLNHEAARHDTQVVQQEVLVAVASAYYTTVQAEAILLISQSNVTQALAHRDQAQIFFKAGRGVRYAVVKAEVDYANAQLALVKSRNVLQTSRLQLAAVLGAMIDSSAVIADNESDLAADSHLSLDSAVAQALAARPDVRAGALRLHAAQAQLDAARRAWLPMLGAQGNYGYRSPEAPLAWQEYWNAGATLQWPLFSGGAQQGQIDQAKGALTAAQAAQKTLEQNVILEVTRQQAAMQEAKQRLEISAQTIDQAALALALAQERLTVGSGSALELSDAEASLTNAQVTRVQAICDLRIARTKLKQATGTLFVVP